MRTNRQLGSINAKALTQAAKFQRRTWNTHNPATSTRPNTIFKQFKFRAHEPEHHSAKKPPLVPASHPAHGTQNVTAFAHLPTKQGEHLNSDTRHFRNLRASPPCTSLQSKVPSSRSQSKKKAAQGRLFLRDAISASRTASDGAPCGSQPSYAPPHAHRASRNRPWRGRI